MKTLVWIVGIFFFLIGVVLITSTVAKKTTPQQIIKFAGKVIAKRVINDFQNGLSLSDLTRFVKGSGQDPKRYELYVNGRWIKVSPSDYKKVAAGNMITAEGGSLYD